jgi:hypothetical protein
VSDKRKQESKYFTALLAEYENGGASRLLYELLNMDLSGFNPYTIPQTKELLVQKMQSTHLIITRSLIYRSEFCSDCHRVSKYLKMIHGITEGQRLR